MNIQLTEAGPLIRPRAIEATRRSRPPNPLERIALHLGVALIIWSRRGRRQPDRAELIRSHKNRLARDERERGYQSASWRVPHG